jgi:hypothetical protein
MASQKEGTGDKRWQGNHPARGRYLPAKKSPRDSAMPKQEGAMDVISAEVEMDPTRPESSAIGAKQKSGIIAIDAEAPLMFPITGDPSD